MIVIETKMPKNCIDCEKKGIRFVNHCQLIFDAKADVERHPSCPLKEIIADKAESVVEQQEPKYCDRNICTSNEYNGIECNECEVTKSQEKMSDFTEEDISGKYYGHEEYTLTDEDIEKLKAGKKLYAAWDDEYTISLEYKK